MNHHRKRTDIKTQVEHFSQKNHSSDLIVLLLKGNLENAFKGMAWEQKNH